MSMTDQWQIVELKHDGAAAWLTSRLDAYKQPAWMKQWPFAHTIEMTYRLQAGVLEVRTKVVNLSAEPMPVALGYHPWFQLTDSPREEWTVTVPARTRWRLSHQKVPTGETEPTDTFFPGFKGALKDYNLDDVFTDLVRDAQGRVTTTVKGRSQQIELTQGPNFRALIVYSPNPLNTGRGSQIPPPDPSAQPAVAAAAPAGRGAALRRPRRRRPLPLRQTRWRRPTSSASSRWRALPTRSIWPTGGSTRSCSPSRPAAPGRRASGSGRGGFRG